jgi:hypothetical protein
MNRVHHPYWKWEEFHAGMWEHIGGQRGRELLQLAIAFTGDHIAYGAAMLRVVSEWPMSCEHNLSDVSMNRLAWIGHAACCLERGVPEAITRAAWGLLSDEQRDQANKKAQEAVDEWESQYSRQGAQLCLELEETRVRSDTGRSRPAIGGIEQSAVLQECVQSDSEERSSLGVARFSAAKV